MTSNSERHFLQLAQDSDHKKISICIWCMSTKCKTWILKNVMMNNLEIFAVLSVDPENLINRKNAKY